MEEENPFRSPGQDRFVNQHSLTFFRFQDRFEDLFPKLHFSQKHVCVLAPVPGSLRARPTSCDGLIFRLEMCSKTVLILTLRDILVNLSLLLFLPYLEVIH